jgi:hypothetical protein
VVRQTSGPDPSKIKCKGNEPDTSSLGLFFLFFVGPRDKDVFPLVSFPVKHFIKELDGAELVSLPLMLDLTLKPICLVFWFYKYISWALTYSIKEKQERRDLSSVQIIC